MTSPWQEENWREASGIIATARETNSMLAHRDYSVNCAIPSKNLIGVYAGVWLWWCSNHHQPEMYCREARAKNSIDLSVLKRSVKTMKPRQKMYELIKAELKRRGHWKNIAGGKPMKSGYDSRRNVLS